MSQPAETSIMSTSLERDKRLSLDMPLLSTPQSSKVLLLRDEFRELGEQTLEFSKWTEKSPVLEYCLQMHFQAD